MPKLRIVDKVNASRCGEHSWLYLLKRTDRIKAFCLECCPHENEPCKGYCAEQKEFEKANKKKNPRRK